MGLLSPSIVFANHASIDISIYGSLGWSPPDFNTTTTYQLDSGTDNFWVHSYDTTLSYTHSGNDFGFGASGANGEVKSCSFGRIASVDYGNSHKISVNMLLNSGEDIFFNYLHTDPLTENLSDGDYISKYQYLGLEGGAGGYDPHLHLEASSEERVPWFPTASAYPCRLADAPCEDRRNQDHDALRKDLLEPHYSSGTPAVYRLHELVEHYDVLLPYFSLMPLMHDLSNYKVYGIEGHSLYGSLLFYRANSKSFDEISIYGQRLVNLCDPQDNSCFEKYTRYSVDGGGASWFFRFFSEVVNNTEVFSQNNNTYSRGTYIFNAVVQKDQAHDLVNGYSVLMEILRDGDIIVDNDQVNIDGEEYTDSIIDSDTMTEPGYYLSSKLVRNNSGNWARWKPGTPGKYRIFAYVSSGATVVDAQYRISVDGSADNLIVTDSINQSNTHSEWVELKSANNDFYDFTGSGYVEYLANNVLSSNWVSIDAVKFIQVSNTGSYFTDVPSNVWFYKYVDELVQKGVVHGYPNRTFRPANYINRVEFLKMACEASGQLCCDTCDDCHGCINCQQGALPYTDLDTGEWYYPYVRAAYWNNWISHEVEEFDPAGYAKRGWSAAVLVRAKNIQNAVCNQAQAFNDVNVGDLYYEDICIAKQEGVLSGYPDGSFMPNNNINRAETSKIIVNTFMPLN